MEVSRCAEKDTILVVFRAHQHSMTVFFILFSHTTLNETSIAKNVRPKSVVSLFMWEYPPPHEERIINFILNSVIQV